MIARLPPTDEIEAFVEEQTAKRIERACGIVSRVGLPLTGMTEARFGSELAHWLWQAETIANGEGRAARRKEAERIARSVARLQRDIERFVSAYGYVPTFSADGAFFTAESCQRELEGFRTQFDVEAHQAAEDLRERRGFEKFIARDLADFFERAFEQPAKVLRGEDGGPDLKEVFLGPFVKFVQAIIEDAGSSIEASSIHAYIKGRKGKGF